jgi:hypothetical protein
MALRAHQDSIIVSFVSLVIRAVGAFGMDMVVRCL